MDQILRDWAGRIARFAGIASAKSDGSCVVAGRTFAGGKAASSIPARLLAPFGLRSVPPPMDCALIQGNGTSRGAMAFPCDTAQYGPDDLDPDGAEVALYNANQPRALVVSDDDLIAQEGDKKVATDTTPITQGTIRFTVVMGTGPLALSIVSLTVLYTPGDGSTAQTTAPLLAGNLTGAITLHEKVDGGSPHFLAPGP